jgi:hypothetical protein
VMWFHEQHARFVVWRDIRVTGKNLCHARRHAGCRVTRDIPLTGDRCHAVAAVPAASVGEVEATGKELIRTSTSTTISQLGKVARGRTAEGKEKAR